MHVSDRLWIAIADGFNSLGLLAAAVSDVQGGQKCFRWELQEHKGADEGFQISK